MELNTLINKARIEKRVEEIAKQIEKDYENKTIVFVGLLKGSTVFMCDLARKIKNNVILEFIDITNHEDFEKEKVTKVNYGLKIDIENKDVILVEDLIDTGRTLSFAKEYILSKNPSSLEIATLVLKPTRSSKEIGIKYMGYKIDDKFVVGYGMDYKDNYRNLPYIGYIEK